MKKVKLKLKTNRTLHNVVGLAIAGLVVLSQTAAAQVNIERLRSDNDGLHFELGANFLFRSGNTDFVELGSSGRLDYLQDRYHIFSIGNVSYGESAGNSIRNRAFFHQRVNYAVTEIVTAELFGQIEQDEFVLLQLRLLGGAGVRFQLIDNDEYEIYVGIGGMYEREDLDVNKVSTHPAKTSIFRSTNYLSTRIAVSEGLDVLNIVYVQPRLDAFDDTRILNDGRLVFKVSDHVSWSNSILIRYDGGPPDDIESTDIDLKSGLTISF